MLCKKTVRYLLVNHKHQPIQGIDKVSVRNSNDVADLRDMVKARNSIEGPAARLVIWRCKDPKTTFDNNELNLQVSEILSDKLKKVEELDPRDKLGVLKLLKTELLLVQIPHLYTPRHETVAGIYQKLQENKYIQIRGTPASGKTTLAKLLHQHILEKEQDPEPLVAFVPGWKDRDSMDRNGGWRRWLAKARIWNAEKNSVLIVDEAQESYWDASFWDHIKDMKDNYPHRIVTLVSHGSTGEDPSVITNYSPMQKQVVGLNAIDYGDGIKVGLFLTATEFHDFVCKRFRGHCFDEEFLDHIYGRTDGHFGACDVLLRIVRAHASYRSVKSVGGRYTSIDLHENIKAASLFKLLTEDPIFSRGLPPIHLMQKPGTTDIFREVLRNGKKTVVAPPCSGESIEPDLQTCIRNGWLYAEHPPPDMGSHDYVFPSPLHAQYIQWWLFDRSKGDGPDREGSL